MTIFEVIKELVDEKKEQIQKEISVINEGITYLQLLQEDLISSEIISDEIIEMTFECVNNQRSLELIKAKFEVILPYISDTDEVSDIYTHYGLVRSEWLETYKKGKA